MSTHNMFDSRASETEHWLLAYKRGKWLKSAMEDNSLVEQVEGEMWPFLEFYHSPLNAVFTPFFKSEIRDARNPDRDLLLRDGAIPLTWFFSRFTPESVGGRPLVHCSLAPLVPDAWRDHMRYYRFRSAAPIARPEALILAFTANELVLDDAEFDFFLDQIEDRLGKRRMQTLKTKLFFRVLGGPEDRIATLMEKIFTRLPCATASKREWLEGFSSLRDYAYLEMNGGWIWQDSFLQQRVLARGASLLLNPPQRNDSALIPLSASHSVEILGSRPIRHQADTRFKQLETFYKLVDATGELGESKLWPAWQERAVRAAWNGKLNHRSAWE